MKQTTQEKTNLNENKYGFLVGKYDLEDYSKKISQMLKRSDIATENEKRNKYSSLIEKVTDTAFELKLATDYISARISNVEGVIEAAKILDKYLLDFELNGMEHDEIEYMADSIYLELKHINGTLTEDQESSIYAIEDLIEYYLDLDESREFLNAVYHGYYEQEEIASYEQ